MLSRSARRSSSTSIRILIPILILLRPSTTPVSVQCGMARRCRRPTSRRSASLTAACWFGGRRLVTTSTTTPSSTARSAAGCRSPTESTPTPPLTSGRRRHRVLSIDFGCSVSAGTLAIAHPATLLHSASTVCYLSRCQYIIRPTSDKRGGKYICPRLSVC